MKFLYNVLCIVCLFAFFVAKQVNAQELIKAKDFAIKTPFLEPDGRSLTARSDGNTFVTLAKHKGGMTGSSEYIVEKHDEDLGSVWSVFLFVPANENFFDIKIKGDKVLLFSTRHDEKTRETKLKVRTINYHTAEDNSEFELWNHKVGQWVDSHNKGSVIKKLSDYINSGTRHNFVTPLQFKYYLAESPDGNSFIAYFYDNSKTDLLVDVLVFDADLNTIDKAQIPIDRGYINYGIYVNNKNDIFILNSSRNGSVTLIKYDLESKDSELLELKPSHTFRTDYKLIFENDEKVLVANLNEVNGRLSGVMYSLFNFETNRVDEVNYFEIEDLKKLYADRFLFDFRNVNDDWLHYDLHDFFINGKGDKVFLLEKREYSFIGFLYDPTASNHVKFWQERKAHVITEDILVLSFNRFNILNWANRIPKKQSNMANEGLNSISFAYNLDNKNNIKVVYSNTDGRGSSSAIHYVELSGLTGERTRELKLPNKGKISLLRDYTQWFNDHIIVVGKKGFTGRSSTILKYKVE